MNDWPEGYTIIWNIDRGRARWRFHSFSWRLASLRIGPKVDPRPVVEAPPFLSSSEFKHDNITDQYVLRVSICLRSLRVLNLQRRLIELHIFSQWWLRTPAWSGDTIRSWVDLAEFRRWRNDSTTPNKVWFMDVNRSACMAILRFTNPQSLLGLSPSSLVKILPRPGCESKLSILC